ncbi:PTS sugar transporter subunit IIB [Allofustis seminis]|uniref:PTS sugar transporter subunit IIB n=1 Tax=Allofustis seminis TaxID=166939 RepID=UPI00035EC849|nr:PTS sugar transporter subunit IIB [Allofustis seminis]
MKIAAVCGMGMGSSFILEMNIKDSLKELNISDVEVDHFDLTSATPGSADLFVVAADLAPNLAQTIPSEDVIVLSSIVEKEELKQKLAEKLI